MPAANLARRISGTINPRLWLVWDNNPFSNSTPNFTGILDRRHLQKKPPLHDAAYKPSGLVSGFAARVLVQNVGCVFNSFCLIFEYSLQAKGYQPVAACPPRLRAAS